jgi:hypothetical protein
MVGKEDDQGSRFVRQRGVAYGQIRFLTKEIEWRYWISNLGTVKDVNLGAFLVGGSWAGV